MTERFIQKSVFLISSIMAMVIIPVMAYWFNLDRLGALAYHIILYIIITLLSPVLASKGTRIPFFVVTLLAYPIFFLRISEIIGHFHVEERFHLSGNAQEYSFMGAWLSWFLILVGARFYFEQE